MPGERGSLPSGGWDFTNAEANALHAAAFDHRAYHDSEWDWVRLCNDHSLGWVTARVDDRLVGFVDVLWAGSSTLGSRT